MKTGTIVKATQYRNNRPDYVCQAVLYWQCGDKYAVDFNGTHAMLVDEIEAIPTMTKKEAKQRVSELFSNSKNVTSQQIREIIDLIEVKDA
jgi:hypothetical protein